MRNTYIALLLALSACCALSQVTEDRIVDGKQITCLQGGLWSYVHDCGTQSAWYTYVFLGSITAISPASDDEKQLQITPQEIFLGNPPANVTVVTSQGLCLPKLTVGDSWLFFLHQEPGQPFMLGYGDRSQPAAEAQHQIETFRRLKTIGSFAIVRGEVSLGEKAPSHIPPPASSVLAVRQADHQQFVAALDAHGHYEFPALPPGQYNLSFETQSLASNADAKITGNTPNVTPGSCWDISLAPNPSALFAHLSGKIKYPDGSPVPNARVLIASEDNSTFSTIEADSHGVFSQDVYPGNFFVGTQLQDGTKWDLVTSGCSSPCTDLPKEVFYYPGSLDRANAVMIELKAGGTRGDINITLPNH